MVWRIRVIGLGECLNGHRREGRVVDFSADRVEEFDGGWCGSQSSQVFGKAYILSVPVRPLESEKLTIFGIFSKNFKIWNVLNNSLADATGLSLPVLASFTKMWTYHVQCKFRAKTVLSLPPTQVAFYSALNPLVSDQRSGNSSLTLGSRS